MVDDVPPQRVWDALLEDKQARLVDVRTDAEWNFVGIPNLGETGHDPVLIPWQVYPAMQVNGSFVDHLRQAGLTPEHKLYFLCRSGGRSLAAARAAEAAGFPLVYNIESGFEGPPDDEGHRGQTSGWKASGLPWQQR